MKKEKLIKFEKDKEEIDYYKLEYFPAEAYLDYVEIPLKEIIPKILDSLEAIIGEDYKPIDRKRNTYHEDKIKGYNQAKQEIRKRLQKYGKKE